MHAILNSLFCSIIDLALSMRENSPGGGAWSRVKMADELKVVLSQVLCLWFCLVMATSAVWPH